MKTNEHIRAVCPKCGQAFTEHPALSRIDNETYICPGCGTREALATLNISIAEQDEIIRIIHDRTHPNT